MDNVVAARRLRKSMLKDLENIDLESLNINNKSNIYKGDINKEENINKRDMKFKNKLLINIFLSVSIIFISLIIKLCFYNDVKDNKFISFLVREYNINYEKIDVTNSVENFFRNNKEVISYIVPTEICEYVKSMYYNNYKDNYLNFSVKNVFNNIINNNTDETTKTLSVFSDEEVNVYIYDDNDKIIDENIGVGGGPSNVDVNPVSAISSMDIDIETIKNKNISIIQPTYGTITSIYGAREVIFKDIGEYHTGVDIANSINTDIKSATTGIVTKLEHNNKYWGNYIIITTDEVTFRYAHLNEIKVELNQKVNQGDSIGKMGSTGYSTGSHLHFEIAINSRTVDPQKLVDIR